MSFIISRGYAEIHILKTSESDPLSFWNILYASVQILKKSKTGKDITQFHICKKKKKKKKNKRCRHT